jgi:hypothetical protein
MLIANIIQDWLFQKYVIPTILWLVASCQTLQSTFFLLLGKGPGSACDAQLPPPGAAFPQPLGQVLESQSVVLSFDTASATFLLILRHP